MLLTGLNRTCVVGHVELRLLVIFLILKCLIMVYHKVPALVRSYFLITLILSQMSSNGIQMSNITFMLMTLSSTCVDPRKPGETDRVISILSNCISEIKNWMSNNMFLLNDDKTEFFVAANPRLMNILSDISITIHVGNTVIRPSLSIRNLGVTFDSAMTMSNHISSICKTLNFHLRNLSRVTIFI